MQYKKFFQKILLLFMIIISIIGYTACIVMYLNNIFFGGIWYIFSIFFFIFISSLILVYVGFRNNEKILINKKINPRFVKTVRIIIWTMLVIYLIQWLFINFLKINY